jgi:hypothetical protein
MNTIRAGLIGAGIGGASMFLLDPQRGAGRRAFVRAKATSAARKTRDAASTTGRDLGNRLSGLRSKAGARFSDESVDDATLGARVRSALGRATPRPRSIGVNAADGWVTLTGDALEADVPTIVSAVGAVRGVKGVQNEIRAHATADGVPALQGRPARPARWMRGRGWSPTTKLLAGASVATGAIAIAAALARADGRASAGGCAPNARTTPPSPEQEAAEGFETEIGILIVGTAPTERGTFGGDDFGS